MNNQKDIIQHFGVLGMHWGQHLRSAGEAHDARTLARDQARKTKISNAVSKFNIAGKAHDARTLVRDQARKTKISNAVSKFNTAGKAHDARTLARDKARQERVRKIGIGFDKGSYNGRVFYEEMANNFQRVLAAQIGGKVLSKMGLKSAGTVLKYFGTTYAAADTAASLILRTTKTGADGVRKNILPSTSYVKDK